MHMLLSSTLVKLVPSTHASHRRSAVAEPAVFWPWPAGQVAQAEHAPLPAAVLNWPAAHAAQSRSDVVVGAALRYSPAAHSALTEAHALLLSSTLLKVLSS